MGSTLTNAWKAGLQLWNDCYYGSKHAIYQFVSGLKEGRPNKEAIVLLDQDTQELLVKLAYFFEDNLGRFLLVAQARSTDATELTKKKWRIAPNLERAILQAGDRLSIVTVPAVNGPLSGSVKIVFLNDEVGIPYDLLSADDQEFVEIYLSERRR